MKRAFLFNQFACAGLGIILSFSISGCGAQHGSDMPVPENSPPLAYAGADHSVAVATGVMLDGGGSNDADGDALVFAWTLNSRPEGSSAALSNADTAYPTITADVAGTYAISLVVSDGLATSADTVVITSLPSGDNDAPVAYAGPDRHPGVGFLVTLDGSASYDMDGDPLTYHWYLNSKPVGSNADLSDRFIINPTFTPDVPGVYTVVLVVNDGTVDSPYNSATITASLTAVANAGPDQYHTTGPDSEITLDGSGSYDSTDKSLTYTWSFQTRPVGSTAVLSDPAAVHPTFKADLEGKYVISLVVNNGFANSSPDTVTVIVITDKMISGLPFKVIDAEYSKELDKIIMVSGTPSNQLHIYDPVSGQDTPVDLVHLPTSVSVGPDGKYAAVGYSGFISYVDLATPALVKTLPVAVETMSDIVLAGNGYVYAFPATAYSAISCVNIATGEVTSSTGMSLSANTRARLLPGGTVLYDTDAYIIQKFDLSEGTAAFLYDSSNPGFNYTACGDIWMSEDGMRIYTRCGKVFPASSGNTRDLAPIGSIQNLGFTRQITHSSAAGKVAAIPEYDVSFNRTSDDTEVQIFDDESLALEKSVSLPRFSVNGSRYAGHGRFVFYDSTGVKMFVVLQADAASGLLNDHGIIIY